jgi:cysteine desulfurase / selenocysteine lyase
MSSMPALPAGFNAEAEFPILRHWDFFNHAGVAPIANCAAVALEKYLVQARDAAYVRANWYAQAEVCRNLAAKLTNAHSDEIAFIKNTSEGLAFVANGLDWKVGDEVVSTAVEYPANVYPWMDLAQRVGICHVMVPENNGRIELESIFGALTPRTRMVALSHVEYASGFRNDIAAIGAECRRRGILFCVDAIQSMGVVPVDVQAMKIDYLSADGHKWMLGPEGAGIFYCRRELLGSLRPEVGWMNVVNAQEYGNYDFTLKPDARRFECGSYNIPGVLALAGALQVLTEVGIDLIERRVLALTEHLCEGLRAKGYAVFSSRKPGESSGIVTFTSATHEHKKIVRELQEQKIIIVLREGRMRASPHFYNSPQQIDRLLAALP